MRVMKLCFHSKKFFMLNKYILAFCLSFGPLLVFAQPANDDCDNPIELTDLASWCSDAGAFTNVNATDSGYGPASCFNSASNDVWFTFTPTATDVTITVIGSQVAGNTLSQPEIALYTGTCGGTLNEEQCESAGFNDIVELYKGGLIVGLPYLIRIQGRVGNTGTFELCINNYNPPVNPGSDCETAAVLCSKETFVVQQVSGPGADPEEANDAPCLNIFGGNVESNSTWFTWTAANNGNLTFTLTPLNPPDDLDFVVYSWPNGPQNCNNQVVLRCMASSCEGPTGLNESSTDTSEPPNCDDSSQDNFLAELDMQTGTTYALMVNNFSATGNGFEISFGGNGEFLGPTTAFMTEPADVACIDQPVSFIDASSFGDGQITDWEWSFGPGSTPNTATGPGPHAVSFDSPGTKSIVLVVTTDQGCQDTEISTLLVECCDGDFQVDADITNVACPDDSNGAIDITVTNDAPPYGFQWDTGSDQEDISNLLPGDYTITISDEATCDTVITFTVESPEPLMLNPNITMPTCNGGTDGAIVLEVEGGTPPLEYNWENAGFGPDNTLTDISQGDYNVVVRDMNGCEESLLVEVRELELILDPNVVAVTPPSCAGFNDGSIEVIVINGTPPYMYDWNDGNGFVDENSLLNVMAGTYTVEVLDANLCSGTFEFNMEDYPPLEIQFDQINASCNGISDGEATAVPSGGNGNYSYQWSTGASDATIQDLDVGSYSVTVTDENGCEATNEVTITEPDPIILNVTDIQDVLCHGDSTGAITLDATGGTPPFEYSADGLNFQTGTTLSGLLAGDYTLAVLDGQGCTTTAEAFIDQPVALTVNAGEDQTIDLGYSVDIRAVVSAFPVTFAWSPVDSLSCVDCPNPTASPSNTTTYLLTVLNEDNCSAVDSITITVAKNRPIYIPNAFSPNDDGVNDFFTIYGGPAARSIANFQVFDRWGAQIFAGKGLPMGQDDPSRGWDGKINGEAVSPGVYAYFVEVEFIDNVTILYEGDITVVR